MSKSKNSWSKDNVIREPNQLRDTCLKDLSANSVIIFSIGSFVGSDYSEYQSSIQMHPTFADSLVDLGHDVKVFNLDISFGRSPILEPALQKAQVFYSTLQFKDDGIFQDLIQQVFNANAKVILIDNCSRELLPLTRFIGLNNASKIQDQLEIIHRYIFTQDGIAFIYHRPAFQEDVVLTSAVKMAMAPADGANCYAGGGSHLSKRQRWIEKQEEHQERLGDMATFFAEGLKDITTDHLFQTLTLSDIVDSDESSDEDDKASVSCADGFKIAAFILAVFLTFPISLPVLGFYYGGHFNEKGADVLSRFIPELFISSKYEHLDTDTTTDQVCFSG